MPDTCKHSIILAVINSSSSPFLLDVNIALKINLFNLDYLSLRDIGPIPFFLTTKILIVLSSSCVLTSHFSCLPLSIFLAMLCFSLGYWTLIFQEHVGHRCRPWLLFCLLVLNNSETPLSERPSSPMWQVPARRSCLTCAALSPVQPLFRAEG